MELSWDEIQQIPQDFVKAMDALFIAHCNHKRLLFLHWTFRSLSQILKWLYHTHTVSVK